jgi:general secretion pathway protein I
VTPRGSGFTLIEVMVALAIVAVALAAGLRAAAALTDNAERLASVTEAQWCAENHVVDMKMKGLPPTGNSEFSCTQLGRTYTGRVLVRPFWVNADQRQITISMFSEAGVPLTQIISSASR